MPTLGHGTPLFSTVLRFWIPATADKALVLGTAIFVTVADCRAEIVCRKECLLLEGEGGISP
jgi:hypothetical protein